MRSEVRKRRLVPLNSRYGNDDKFAQAASMRNNPTPAEERMWEILNTKVIAKYPKHRFLPQHVLFGYILDFYCPTLRICIEMDGEIHDYRKDYDEIRDKNLKRNAIVVFHFQNKEVFKTPKKVANRICKCIKAKLMCVQESF